MTNDKTHFGYQEVPAGEKARRVGDVFRSVFNVHNPAGDPLMRSTLADTKFVP